MILSSDLRLIWLKPQKCFKYYDSIISQYRRISLLVGGIGIMNIMLVSLRNVSRKSVSEWQSALRKKTSLQFIIEAVMISLLGGIMGILIGYGAAAILAKVMSWTVSITIWSVILSVGFSCAIGIFFGWYPARSRKPKSYRCPPI
jgi:putative ABC transport system permease protein